MMTKSAFFILIAVITVVVSCSGKPSDAEIKKKLLQEFVCAANAKVNDLKILKTEETESSPDTHIFKYTVRGEVV